MQSRNRGLRRHHMQRLKAKRSRYNNAGHCSFGNVTPVSVGITYHTPCRCSCWMCGNQRDHHGMNMQEVKSRAKHLD